MEYNCSDLLLFELSDIKVQILNMIPGFYGTLKPREKFTGFTEADLFTLSSES